MVDRELLEFAAKAAGYEVVGPAPKYIAQGCNEWALIIRNDRGGDSVFDPLTDDGDALRLSVKLAEQFSRSVIGVFNRGAFPYASASVVHHDGAETYIEQDVADDPLSATRRAIVRAAAAIGKAMP